MLLLESLNGAATKLEKYSILRITKETIFEVVEVMRGAASAWIRIDWLDQVIEKIHKKREHNELVQKANILRVQVKEITEQLHMQNIS